jgi:hypothetical protein
MRETMDHTDPVFVAGFGRSGTNWLLNLLDLHEATHCRNEPDVLATSQFKRLPSPERPVAAESEFAALWDVAVQWACQRYGERDRMPRRHKSYLRDRGIQLGVWRLLEKHKARALLSVTSPSLRQAEWTIPWWLDTTDALSRARHVLKLNDRHCWFAWVMAHRPAARVLHLVRHPGGVLQSWRSRWLAKNDPQFVRAECLARLARISQVSPAWAARFGELEELDTAAAELWYWRYSTEAMWRSGAQRPGYKRLLYEDLVNDPVTELRDVYAFCGLSWDAGIEREIDPRQELPAERSRWYERVSVDPSAASEWRARTSAADHALIARVLEGSPLQHWWREAC